MEIRGLAQERSAFGSASAEGDGAATPPPKSRRVSRSAIMVAAVVVAVSFILTFLLRAPDRPTVQLGAPYYVTDLVFVVNVTSVSPPLPTDSVRVNLAVNGSSGQPSVLSKYMLITISGYTYMVDWDDVNHDSLLSAGDRFGVGVYAGPTSGYTTPVTFQLLSSAGHVLASAVYTPPP